MGAYQKQILELLCMRGADTEQGDKNGVTPLALAVSLDKKSLMNVLQQAGGTLSASSHPCKEEPPDPMLKTPPPWALAGKETIEYYELKETDEAGETEDDVKDDSSVIDQMKSCFPCLIRRRNKKTMKRSESPKKTWSLEKKEKLKALFAKKFRSKGKQSLKVEKGFEKVWLTDEKGNSLKMYTFRINE